MKLIVEIPKELDFVKLAHSADGWEACIRTRPGCVDRHGNELPPSIGWGFKQRSAGQALTLAAQDARTKQGKLLWQRNAQRGPTEVPQTEEEALFELLGI